MKEKKERNKKKIEKKKKEKERKKIPAISIVSQYFPI